MSSLFFQQNDKVGTNSGDTPSLSLYATWNQSEKYRRHSASTVDNFFTAHSTYADQQDCQPIGPTGTNSNRESQLRNQNIFAAHHLTAMDVSLNVNFKARLSGNRNGQAFDECCQEHISEEGLLSTQIAQTLSSAYFWGVVNDTCDTKKQRDSVSIVEEIFADIPTENSKDNDLEELMASETFESILSENRKILEGDTENIHNHKDINFNTDHANKSGFPPEISGDKMSPLHYTQTSGNNECFIPDIKVEHNTPVNDCLVSSASTISLSDLILPDIKAEPSENVHKCEFIERTEDIVAKVQQMNTSCAYEGRFLKDPPSYNIATSKPRGLSAHAHDMHGLDLAQSLHGPPQAHPKPQQPAQFDNDLYPFNNFVLTSQSSPIQAATHRQQCSIDSTSMISRSSSSDHSLPPTPPDSQPGSPSEGSPIHCQVTPILPYTVELIAQCAGSEAHTDTATDPSRFSPAHKRGVTSPTSDEKSVPVILTPVTQRPRRTHPGCTTIKYNRKNNPDLDRRRVHFCEFPG